MKNQKQIVALAAQFLAIDEERLDLERKAKDKKKELEGLKVQLQELIGAPDKSKINVPQVDEVGKLVISQVWNHRDGHEVKPFDFLSFKVASK